MGGGLRWLGRESRAVGVEREEMMSGTPAEGLDKRERAEEGWGGGRVSDVCARTRHRATLQIMHTRRLPPAMCAPPPPRRALPHCAGGLCDYTRAPPASANAHLSKAVKAATVVVAPEPAATTAAMATASAEATPEPAESAAAASADATATAAAVAATAAAAAAEIVLAEAASDPA